MRVGEDSGWGDRDRKAMWMWQDDAVIAIAIPHQLFVLLNWCAV